MNHDALQRRMESLLREPLASVVDRERRTYGDLTGIRNRAIVLFGAGRLGRRALAGLREMGVEPLAFCDNNRDLWATAIDGVIVMSPADAASRFGRYASFVVTIWGPHDRDTMRDRRQQLVDLGCETVVPFAPLFWTDIDAFGSYYAFDLPHRSIEESESIRRAFTLWADDRSRAEFVAQVEWRLTGDFDVLSSPVGHETYFPDDLVDLRRDEVFVDCGAYNGDTIRGLLERVPDGQCDVLAFEPDPANLPALHDYLDTLPDGVRGRISVYEAAVGATRGRIAFDSTGTEASTSGVGGTYVDCLPLDELDDGHPPSYVKMDIEGAELDALTGATGVITRFSPVLAICVYHQYDHPWRVPLLIAGLSQEYQYFLRPHRLQAWDLVCYAVPRARLKRQVATRN